MRFSIAIHLDNPVIPKDKNKMILSLFKHCLSNYDPRMYEDLYESGEAKQKNFTFSLYMPECKFLREVIEIPSQKLFVNFSTYDLQLGIQFFNAFLKQKRLPYKYRENVLTIQQAKLQTEKILQSERILFQTVSPCVVREHIGDNKSTWFHSLSESKGQEIFLENLKAQARMNFPQSQKDIDNLSLEVFRNKEVKVKHYGIEVLGNIALFQLRGKTYLLDYFYKAGAGSMKSTGFSMLDVKEEVME